MTEEEFREQRSRMVCTNDINVNTLTYQEALKLISEDKCASFVVTSQPGIYVHFDISSVY